MMNPEIVSSSKDRVRQHSPETANRRIDREILARLVAFKAAPQGIKLRLQELDAEWDVERIIIAQAASASLLGVLLAARFSRKWLFLPGVVLPFLLQFALQGWCPPVEVWRRAGKRTRREIEAEKFALKAMRGDFDHARGDVDRAVTAVQG